MGVLVKVPCIECKGERLVEHSRVNQYSPRCASCAHRRVMRAKRISTIRPVLRDIAAAIETVRHYIDAGDTQVVATWAKIQERYTKHGQAEKAVSKISDQLAEMADDLTIQMFREKYRE